MTRYAVGLTTAAREDLSAIEHWIAAEAGEDVAARYVDRVEALLAKLDYFPRRGTLRDDLGEAIRSVTFERRLIIVFEVGERTVSILRIVHAARDIAALFDD